MSHAAGELFTSAYWSSPQILTSRCDALLLYLHWKRLQAQLNTVWQVLHAIGCKFMHRAGIGI
jgi:hypothetical protein